LSLHIIPVVVSPELVRPDHLSVTLIALVVVMKCLIAIYILWCLNIN
jgi:hypothetical protein